MAVALPGMVLVTRVMGRRSPAYHADRAGLHWPRLGRGRRDGGAASRTVMSFAPQKSTRISRFRQKVTTLFKAAMLRTRVYATLGPLISAADVWQPGPGCCGSAGREDVAGRLTAGQLIAFLFLCCMLTGRIGVVDQHCTARSRRVGRRRRAASLSCSTHGPRLSKTPPQAQAPAVYSPAT